jgi:hypothetical protein
MISVFAYAQLVYDQDDSMVKLTLSEVSYLGLYPDDSDVHLNMTFGNAMDVESFVNESCTNSEKRLVYTIAKSSNSNSRAIQVHMSYGWLPSNLSISVTASQATGGAGTLGLPSNTVVLSATAKNLITGIGSGYTGNTATSGHCLQYKAYINSLSGLVFTINKVVQVTYTLVEE